ncbi:MAG: choice-of-anchor J domain-containing protein [Muribaculaceae bacterium]|nr:choice-of-anchor J domain-containing protein [Muribaculaceae bacterium]
MKTILACALGLAALTSAGLYAGMQKESPAPKFMAEEPVLETSPKGLHSNNVKAHSTRSSEVKVIPYLATFPTQEMFDEFTVINANNDNKSSGKPCTWYYNDEKQTARYSYSGENNADDWLISPAIHLEEGNEYKLTVNCKNFKSTYYGDYEEKFEVYLGQGVTVDAMNSGKRVMNRKTVRGGTFNDYTNEGITVDKTGDYNLGVHCVSDAYRGELDVKQIRLEVIPKATAPAKASPFTATADESGMLVVKVDFTAPSKTIGGQTLSGNLKRVELRRNGEVIKTYEDVAPGTALSHTDDGSIPNGTNNYQVLTYSENGQGEIAELDVFVGVDVPKAVTNVTYSEPDANTITMSWDPVATVGVNGQRVNPATTKYFLFTTTTTEAGGLAIDELVATVTGENKGSFPYKNDEGTQQRKYFVVIPVTAGGTGDYTMASHYVGKPLSIPFEEHVAENGFQNSTWSYGVSAPKTTILGLSEDASDGDKLALIFYAEAANATGYLTAGKIDISTATNPTLTFDSKSVQGASNSIYVEVERPNGETAKVAEFTPGNSYQKYSVSLKDFAKERYIKFRICCDFKNVGAYLFDNIKLYDIKNKDLSLILQLPPVSDYGINKTPATLLIGNEGLEPVENFSVRFLYRGEPRGEETVNQKIESFGTYSHELTLPFIVTGTEGDREVMAEVVLDGDENSDNNISFAHTTVSKNYLPQPSEMTMSESAGGADITWKEPEGTSGEIEESFEDGRFPAFSLGNLVKEKGEFGNWKVYDGDAMTTYSFQTASLPANGEPSAWQVFNPGKVSESFLDDYNEYKAFDGEQYMIAWCPNDGSPADNWLISPELSGEEQVLNFMYNAINTQYGDETFEVLVSTTGDNVGDFTLLKRGQATEIRWREFEVELPAGTKYFAIRHTSEDVFGMMIDAVTYTPRPNILSGYNLYLDGDVVATKGADAKAYSFNGLNNADMHWYGVSATYDTGESSPVYRMNAAAVAGVDEAFYDGPKKLEGISFDLMGRRVAPDTKGIIIRDGKKVLNR